MYKNALYLFATLLVFYSCNSDNNSQIRDIRTENSPIKVDTVHIYKKLFHKEFFSNGSVEAKKKYQLYTKTEGTIEQLMVSPGSFVEKGSPICKLKNPEIKNNILFKTQEYNKALIDLEDFLIGSGYKLSDSASIPHQIWETACSRSNYRLRKLELEILQTQINNLTVFSPFSGIISNIQVKEGQPISSNELICTLSDINTLIVKFQLLENEYFFIHKGQQVLIHPYTFTGSFFGKIIAINPEISENGLFSVFAEVNNSGHKLIDGMNVKIQVQGKGKEKLVVPKEAIITRNNQNIVFTYSKGKAIWNFVTILDENSKYAVISDELNEGDAVITKGNLFLNYNTPVKIGQK